MRTFVLVHPAPKPDAPALGIRIVAKMARGCGWHSGVYSTRDPIPRGAEVTGFGLYSPLQFPRLPEWLRTQGLEVWAERRKEGHPLVIAGGPACAAPGPVVPFLDAVVMGDAELTVPAMLAAVDAGGGRAEVLGRLAQMEGVYVPAVSEGPARWLRVKSAQGFWWGRQVLVARGCRYRCPYCQVSTLQGPYRPVSFEGVVAGVEAAGRRVSLCAPAMTHHPDVMAILGYLADEGTVVDSTNACHVDLRARAGLVEAFSAVSARVSVGVEGMSARLRQSVGKGISDGDLENLLVELLTHFAFVTVYLIVGLPGEEDPDQEAMVGVLSRVLERRKWCWRGCPGRLVVTSTPFQAMPWTRWERLAAPGDGLVEAWQARVDRLRERYEYVGSTRVKTGLSARVAFALHRMGPEVAGVLDGLGNVYGGSTWGTWKLGKFVRLCERAGVDWQSWLGQLEGDLPWEKYCVVGE